MSNFVPKTYTYNEYINILNNVLSGGDDTLIIGDSIYSFNHLYNCYYEYIKGKNPVEVNKNEINKKINVHLRRYKLEKIMKKI